MKRKFISSTVGMMAYHEAYGESKLVRVNFFETPSGILLVPVSGYSLGTLKKIPQVTISKEEFENRPCETYSDQVEWEWAVSILGFEV